MCFISIIQKRNGEKIQKIIKDSLLIISGNRLKMRNSGIPVMECQGRNVAKKLNRLYKAVLWLDRIIIHIPEIREKYQY